MDKIKETNKDMIISKCEKLSARLVSVEETPSKSAFGYLKGTAIINGDIISPLEEKWNGEN